jgi:hypothetical protein
MKIIEQIKMGKYLDLGLKDKDFVRMQKRK